MRRVVLPLVAVVVIVSLCVLAGFAEEPDARKEAAQVPTLKDVAWLAGHWAEASGTSVLTEIWSAPQGDAMVGCDHWTVDGKTRMYELIVIEQTEKGLVMHLRHFGRGLRIPKAERDAPMSWPLASVEGQKVVFEHPTRAWPKRMTYERKGDVLHAALTGIENGKPNALTFEFRLR